MTGRVKTFDLGPASIEACDTDHSSHRPDAVEWSESRLHVREAMQTRSGRFMPAADLPGQGWVQEVTDLMLTMPWREGAVPNGQVTGLASALVRAWQDAKARNATSLQLSICLPGSPAWVVEMTDADDGLHIRLGCSDAEAASRMAACAESLGDSLKERLQCAVRVSVEHLPDPIEPAP